MRRSAVGSISGAVDIDRRRAAAGTPAGVASSSRHEVSGSDSGWGKAFGASDRVKRRHPAENGLRNGPWPERFSAGHVRLTAGGATRNKSAAHAGDCGCGTRGSSDLRSCSRVALIAEVDERRAAFRVPRAKSPWVYLVGLAVPCESAGRRKSVGSRRTVAKPHVRWRARDS